MLALRKSSILMMASNYFNEPCIGWNPALAAKAAHDAAAKVGSLRKARISGID